MQQVSKGNSSIIVNGLSFEIREGISILKNISLSIGSEKTGLVGPNGSGKTTLLRLLCGQLEPSSGKIIRPKHIAYLPQDYQLDLQQTITEALGVAEKLNALQELKQGGHEQEVIELIGDDWDIQDRISAVFEQLNISNLNLNRPLSSLSGGERMKVVLAKLWIAQPDFIILDEPTNNLDEDSREMVYTLIKEWVHGLLVVSHDRVLLNLLDQIIELSNSKLKVYGGNYDNYVQQKAIEEQAAYRQLVTAQQVLNQTRRQSQVTKEKQQKRASRGKKIRDKLGLPKIMLGMMKETSERTSSRLQKVHEQRVESAQRTVEEAKSKISPNNRIYIDLDKTTVPAGKLVIQCTDVSFAYDQKNFFEHVSLTLHGPVRLALNGPNGSGKTTFIKLILKELQPDNGDITLGVEHWAYLDQGVALLQSEQTLIENVKKVSGLSDVMARKWLAKFLFRGEDVFKTIAMLSGGERMRAGLACVLAGDQPPQLLVLDEPTNNLDLNSIEQIESALLNYQGALIVVSHDRSFLQRIGLNNQIRLPLQSRAYDFGADGRN